MCNLIKHCTLAILKLRGATQRQRTFITLQCLFLVACLITLPQQVPGFHFPSQIFLSVCIVARYNKIPDGGGMISRVGIQSSNLNQNDHLEMPITTPPANLQSAALVFERLLIIFRKVVNTSGAVECRCLTIDRICICEQL